jgi:pimeloyl-ACP methyl ester carboxylesterase
MSSRKTARALGGISLIGLGFWFALPSPYREKTYLISAGGCQLETTIVEKKDGASQGSVLLFHGISANKKIMSYLARGFAEQGLRVYVPDLPGHGRTPGPFSPARAEQCGEALLRELLARGIITADRTILAGHSMGGAIAERIAARVPVAGLIAVSPAPMRAAYGLTAEKLLFTDPPDPPPNSLVMVGELEPESMRRSAAALAMSQTDGMPHYEVIYGATHVSILFSGVAMHSAQLWSKHVLQLTCTSALPSRRPVFGALAGFVGLLLIAGPFSREIAGKKDKKDKIEAGSAVGLGRALGEITVGSMLIVVLLRFWIPLRVLHLFEGEYLASFLILLGAALVVLHWSSLRQGFTGKIGRLLPAALGAAVLLLLFTAWLDLSFTEAWLTVAKWARVPFLFVALLPYLIAEETLLGPVRGQKWRRMALALSFRLIAWGAIMGGVFILHNGEILMALLAPYMALFNVLQRSGMDVVRVETGSPAATAIFGAILQAGFCLVIFPIT